jgi:hypothetical protein
MRTYRKRPSTLRHCAHCHAPFESGHKRRIYCGNSCSTLAYYARKAHAAPAPAQGSITLAAPALPTPGPGPGAQRLTLDWNKQNIAVLSAANFVAQVGANVGKRLWNAFTGPSASAPALPAAGQAADPLDWLPIGLLSSAAPRVTLELPGLNRSVVFVQLTYLGHTFFYQPTQRVLLWRAAPGQLMALITADQLALVTELPVYEETRPLSSIEQPGRLPKFLG